jgi:hypothetical protein
MEHLLKQVGAAVCRYSLKETPAFNGAMFSDLVRAENAAGMLHYARKIEEDPTNTGVCRKDCGKQFPRSPAHVDDNFTRPKISYVQ